MSRLARIFLLTLSLFFAGFAAAETAEYVAPLSDADTILFRFMPGRLMFRSPYKGNDESIARLAAAIDRHRDAILAGDMKVRVNGYCASYPTRARNLAAAKNRSNQVKSHFIIHSGLTEDCFITSNHNTPWRGYRDVVAVASLIRVRKDEAECRGAIHCARDVETFSDVETLNVTDTLPRQDSVPVVIDIPDFNPPVPAAVAERVVEYPRWAVKTNALFLAAGVANIGGEWAFRPQWSLDVPLVYSPYTIARTYTMRFMYVQPEVRYWPAQAMQGHFFGAHVHAGVFNVALNDHSRYQSERGFYGAGISYGYSLPVGRRWNIEFTVGAGYAFTRYWAYYNVHNGISYRQRVPYNYWGITRLGVNIVYHFGAKPERRKEGPAL